MATESARNQQTFSDNSPEAIAARRRAGQNQAASASDRARLEQQRDELKRQAEGHRKLAGEQRAEAARLRQNARIALSKNKTGEARRLNARADDYDRYADETERAAAAVDQQIHQLEQVLAPQPGQLDVNADTAARNAFMASGQPAPTAAPAAPATSPRDQARDLQRRLNSMGANLVVDGIVGPKTRAAMARYGVDANGNPAAGGPAAGPAAPGGGGGGLGAPGPASAGSVEDQVRQKYGYLAWALDLPEIGTILRRAATEGWDDARLRGAVEGTAWWKNSSASMRQWQQQQAEDPATANAKIQAQVDYIRSQSGTFGITIDPGRASAIAADSLKYGWSGTQLQSAILSEFHYVKGQTAGRSAQVEQELRKLAGDYFVPVDDATLGTWVEQSVKEQQDPDSFKHYLIDQAKGLFPGLAKMLDQGLTTRQVAAPYQNLAADELGVGPDQVDFRDPKWGRALTVMDKDGARPMTLYEWQRTIRGDDVYGFKQSAKGRALAADGVLGLAKALGRAS